MPPCGRAILLLYGHWLQPPCRVHVINDKAKQEHLEIIMYYNNLWHQTPKVNHPNRSSSDFNSQRLSVEYHQLHNILTQVDLAWSRLCRGGTRKTVGELFQFSKLYFHVLFFFVCKIQPYAQLEYDSKRERARMTADLKKPSMEMLWETSSIKSDETSQMIHHHIRYSVVHSLRGSWLAVLATGDMTFQYAFTWNIPMGTGRWKCLQINWSLLVF